MGKLKIEVDRAIDLPHGKELYVCCDVYEIDRSDTADESQPGKYVMSVFEFEAIMPEVGISFLRSIDDAPDDCATELTTHDDDGVGANLDTLGKIMKLGTFERQIIETQIARLLDGRQLYGEWKPGDKRDMSQEALEEVLDGLNYVAAMLAR